MLEYNIGDTIDSRYQLKKFLGGGRVGKVYLADDLQKGQEVAIKLLTDRLNSEKERTSFLREFDAVKNLKHPGVVKVYEQGSGYFTMEYVDGDSLAKFKGVDVSQTFELGIDITRVLEYIHRQGVIHRDLKPENIKITSTGQVKIMDFGFAIGHNVTNLITSKQYGIAGTLNYMAPEVIKEFDVDSRADLYSLGIILYELVTNTLPFKSSDLLTTIVKQVEMIPPKPSSFNPKITPGFEAIILKLISKSPSNRFQSADELLSAMMRLAGRSEIIKIKVDKGRKFLYSTKFCGRSRELSQLQYIFRRSMKGRGGFVILQGEHGIGKNRLISEFKALNASEGTIFLDVTCDSSMGASFAAFIQLIYEACNTLEKIDLPYLTELASKWGSVILPIVPALMHKPYMKDIVPKEETQKERLIQYLCSFFVEISRQYSLGIFINNINLLSTSSALLLLQLIESSQDHPIFIAGIYQGITSNNENGIERILARLKNKKLCDEITLMGLSQEETSQMAASTIGRDSMPNDLTNKLYEITQGTPLLIEETIKNMADDGLLIRRGGIWEIHIDDLRSIKRPSLIESVLMQKYDDLDYKDQKILQIASIIGRIFDLSLLEELYDYPEENIQNRILSLTTLRFLNEMQGKIQIGSPLLAEMIYDKIPPKNRQRYHEEVARQLEKLPTYDHKVEELAKHYLLAEQKIKALQYLIAAGGQCEQDYAYDASCKYYKNALTIAQEQNITEAILNLYEKLGNVYSLIGTHDTALQYYSQGLTFAQTLHKNTELFLKGLGRTYFNKGQFAESKKYFTNLLDILRTQKRNMAVELNLVAQAYISTGEYEEADRLLREAVEQARSSNSKEIQADIYNTLANLNFMRGHWNNAQNYYMRTLDLLHYSRNYRLKAQINQGIARIYIHLGQMQLAYKYLEEALYFCYLINDREFRVHLELDLGTLLEYRGHLLHAKDIYNESLELAQDLDMKLGRAQAYYSLAHVSTQYENYLEAAHFLKQSQEIFEELQLNLWITECQHLFSRIYIGQGEYDIAEQYLSKTEHSYATLNIKWKLSRLYMYRAQVYQNTNRLDNANKILNKALKVAKKYNDKIMLGRVHTQYAIFCAEQNLSKEAIEHIITAVVYLEQTECSLDLAKAYYEYGRMLLEFDRRGDHGFIKVAIHQLEKALEIYNKTNHIPMSQKTTLLIKECKREKSDPFYKKDLSVKVREIAREITELATDSMQEIRDFREQLQQSNQASSQDEQQLTEQEEDMNAAEVEKRLAELESKFNQQINQLQKKNESLLNQVEDLKVERESLLTLQKISNTINTVLDSQKLLNLIMDMVIQELRAERGFLVLRDKDEFTFKAARNINQEEIEQQDFLVSRTILKKVMKTGEPVLSSDAKADSQLQSESIMDLKLCSILCVPFKIKEQVIGAVYLDNRFVSGLFTEKDLDFLVAFSNQAAIAIENAFLYEELREKERLEQEICIAARIQAGLLPKRMPKIPGIDVYGKMVPARQVGGDYYDFIPSEDNNLLTLVIGDVAGKGVPAGLVMVMARLLLHHCIGDLHADLQQTLLTTNHILKANTEPFVFMSLLIAQWNAQEQTFHYTGAGHENLLIYREATKEIETVLAGGMVLGVKDDIESSLQKNEIKLQPGDTIVFYTDGVTECVSSDGSMLELNGFRDMLTKHLGESPKALVANLFDELQAYMGTEEQHDDITIMAVRKL